MASEDDHRTSSGSPHRYQPGKLPPRPEPERARPYSGQRRRSDSPPPRKRARSPSYECGRRPNCDRWASTATIHLHEPPRRDWSVSPARTDYRPRPAPEASDSRHTLPARPAPLPSRPGSGKSPSSTELPEIRVSGAVDAMPTRNKNGCIVMVEYDHLLLQHLQAGHKVDSFDTRKLRRRPTLSPRERWLRVQNHLLTYNVIDETLVIPTRPARTRRSASPQASPSSSRRYQTPALESSTARISEPPGTTAVADARPSENHPSLSPERIAGEIPPAGAAEASTSKTATKASSVRESTAVAQRESSVRVSSEMVHSSPSPHRDTLSFAQIHPSLPSADVLAATSPTLHRAFEASPCSVSSPPPASSSSSQPPLASSTDEPSSSEPASTTTDLDPKGDPRILALFDEAIYLCRRFCKLVEEGRKKRQEAAESGREGGGT